MKQLQPISMKELMMRPRNTITARCVKADQNKWIEITMDDTDRFWESNIYDIELTRIKDAAGLLNWCFHLTEKRWMTTQKMRDFMQIASSELGIDLRLLG